MAKTPTITIIVKMSLWDAIKLRIAGIKNVKRANTNNQLVDVQDNSERRGYNVSPFSDEVDPRILKKITPPGCPECKQPMEYENIDAWRGWSCHKCDYHITFTLKDK